MIPYYEHGGVTLFCGDSREVLQGLEAKPAGCVIVTDPVWRMNIAIGLIAALAVVYFLVGEVR